MSNFDKSELKFIIIVEIFAMMFLSFLIDTTDSIIVELICTGAILALMVHIGFCATRISEIKRKENN
jgi:hypothetical protein